jgi:hypothetical protein
LLGHHNRPGDALKDADALARSWSFFGLSSASPWSAAVPAAIAG